MSDAEPKLEVWLATEAADHRAMHDVIAVLTPSYTHVLEPAGWQDIGPVDAALAAAGFTGDGGDSLVVREVPCDVPIVLLRGFSAPESMWPRLRDVIERALTGRLGGFFPVLAGQAFFHRSAMAFEYAWAAAGKPPVRVRPPDLVEGRRAEDGTPGSVEISAGSDVRVSAARKPARESPPEDIPDPWTRGPVEGEDPGEEQLWPLQEST